MLQRKTNTASNRYPGIFRTIRSHLRGKFGDNLGGQQLRILSFGCSSGEEALSIRAYFPDAEIHACDRDPRELQRAAKTLRDDDAHLFLSTPENISRNGPYDLIFAMSVFCQYPDSSRVDNLTEIYPFSLFENLAGNLCKNLKPDGILSLINSNYLFRDLSCQAEFRPMRSPLVAGNGFIDKFAKDGARLTTSFGNKRMYSQRREAEGVVDEDLRDCIFQKSNGPAIDEVRFLDPAPTEPVQLQAFRIVGECLETAVKEQRSAMELRGRLLQCGDGSHWLEKTWHKSTLAGDVIDFGSWWFPSTPDPSYSRTSLFKEQTDELNAYLKQSQSPFKVISNLFRR